MKHKKIRGYVPTFRRQTLSSSKTGMLEAKVKDQEHNAQVFSKKKKRSLKFFVRSPTSSKTKKMVMILAHFQQIKK